MFSSIVLLQVTLVKKSLVAKDTDMIQKAVLAILVQ